MRGNRRFHISMTSGRLFIIVTAFAVVYALLIYNVSTEYKTRVEELHLLQAVHAELVAESIACERELQYVQSDKGVQLYAHMYGYQFPDETCYTAVSAAN